MNSFSNAELVNIHFTYGRLNGNSNLAQRLYREDFPQSQFPSKSTFASIHQHIRKTGSFEICAINSGVQRIGRIVKMDEEVQRKHV